MTKKDHLLIYVILLSSINYKHYQLAARCHVPDAWKSYFAFILLSFESIFIFP